MAPPAAGGSLAVALARRNELGGATGYRALVQNAHVFGLAVFCSLGGLIYGYNQGVFSGILAMPNFTRQIPEAVPAGTKGWLTSILELGAWLGTICTGPIAESIGRKRGVQFAVLIFCIGVIVQVTAYHAGSIYAGRFITGWGVGSISMLVPMYNAEISPPEIRGALVGLQQLSITFGILISFWLDYGTNYIGGTGATQAAAAWRLPLALQLVPGLILGIGFIWMPYSPRFLMMKGREDEALVVLAALRRLPSDHRLVQLEFLEIKAQVVFDRETDLVNFPNVVPGSLRASFEGYKSLFTNRAYFRRVMVACLTMFFQQWTGINAILYYAPSIFEALGLTGNTISLLATGVVGIVMWLATIPAVLYIDKVGRKPVLVSGAILMAICHFIVAGLSGKYEDDWPAHKAAGWVCVVAIWFFVAFFGYSWGPAAWIIVAEVFPSSIRSKGISVGASSNWANNFAVGLATPSMLQHLRFGTYIFFGTLTAMGAAWVQFMVPETKGVTLEEMDVAFGDVAGTSHADLSRKAKIDREIGLEALLFNGETSPSVHSAEKHNEVEKREFTHHA